MRGFLQSSSFKSYLGGAVPVQKEMVKLKSYAFRAGFQERRQGADASPHREVADRLYSAGNHAGLPGVGVSTLSTNHTTSPFGVVFSFPADGWGLKPVWVFGGFTLRKWFWSPTGESSRRPACDLPLNGSRRVNPSYNTSWKCPGDASVRLSPPQEGARLDGHSRAGVASFQTGERQNPVESRISKYRMMKIETVNLPGQNLLWLGGWRALSCLVRVFKKRFRPWASPVPAVLVAFLFYGGNGPFTYFC